MKGDNDPDYVADSPDELDDLDELISGFADRGYLPDGAEIDEAAGAHGEHGHEHGHDHQAGGSVRNVEYRGHQIQIVTRYEVTIDGERWDQPIHVGNDGTVSYHGLPQYLLPSAVDLVRAVIDTSYEAPDDVRAAIRAAREGA